MTMHYPLPESISVHPADREYLDRQLPTAQIYEQPVPESTSILENPAVREGTVWIRIDGSTITAALGESNEPGMMRWWLPEPYKQWWEA